MNSLQQRRRARGVSLIEAIVALAVMAFGMLGVVGVQVSLRSNADVSKQRSEAVRIAQQEIENLRDYSLLAPLTPADGQATYADITTATARTVTSSNSNTSYTLTRTVVDPQTADSQSARVRSVLVSVSWTDRTGNTPTVAMTTQIAGVAPELAGSLGIPGNQAVTQFSPGGRNRAIPAAAVDQGNGTSLFTPPGATNPTLTWTFDNVTGVITQYICDPLCVNNTAFLLSGTIRFAASVGTQALLNAQSEHPSGNAATLPVPQVRATTSPTSTLISNCFQQAFAQYIVYYCAVSVPSALPQRWSGTWMLVGASPPLATSTTETAASLLRVCRYTPVMGDTPPNGNKDHPRSYVNVTSPLVNQNYLVIPAGDGVSTAFSCPPDDASTPEFNGNTWQHQPHS